MNGPFFHGLMLAVLAAAVSFGFTPARAGAEASLFAPVEEEFVEPILTPPPKAGPAKAASKGGGKGASAPKAAAKSKTLAAPASGSAKVVVDEQGHKTLVVRGEAPQASPEIVVDGQGRKTLVIRGDEAGRGDETGPGAAEAAAVTATPAVPPAEKPYWAADGPTAPVRPYFQAEPEAPARPYWLAEPETPARPYWLAEPEAPVRPYWLPAPPEEPAKPAPVVASKPPAGDGADTRTISYYMYQDEAGVKHLTNAPTDPRYRLFTVTVTIQRGLAGTRALYTPGSLGSVINRAAQIYNLDPALIMAVIKSESAFDAQAVSWAGAQGLMQLMPGTARDMGCVNPFDPEDNVMGGSRYLRLMLDRFGDVRLALAAYNCGPERVAREGNRIPPIPETQNYVTIVLRNYDRYQGRF